MKADSLKNKTLTTDSYDVAHRPRFFFFFHSKTLTFPSQLDVMVLAYQTSLVPWQELLTKCDTQLYGGESNTRLIRSSFSLKGSDPSLEKWQTVA